MLAVLYVRVSSEMQRESGSIESQVDYAREHCRLQRSQSFEVEARLKARQATQAQELSN
jgi:DNA invertase Pin-like site-specific DNA recombinase